jgi:hypothetical protein
VTAGLAALLALTLLTSGGPAAAAKSDAGHATLTSPGSIHGAVAEVVVRSPVTAPVLLGPERVTTARAEVEAGRIRGAARRCEASPGALRWLRWRSPGQLRVGGQRDEDPGAS